GAEIHEYQPTPGDIIRAHDADLIFSNGLNLEVWFEKFYKNMQHMPEVVVTDGIEPMSIVAGPYDGKPNPHAWMSPHNALIYVDNIRDAFVEHDPDNAAIYQANAEAYKEEIAAQITPLQNLIAQLPEDQRWLVTSEGAFSYL